MSRVTNLILFIEVMNDTEEEKMAEVNKFFEGGQKPLICMDDPSIPEGWYGGSKMLEAALYVGAVNHLPLSMFIDHIQSIEWGEAFVQIMYMGPEDDGFTLTDVIKTPAYA